MGVLVRIFGFTLVGIGVGLLQGCSSRSSLEASGVSIKVPMGWEPVAATTWPVPGEAISAWKRPGGGSLVLYRTLPIPNPDATALGVEMVTRLQNNVGVTVDPAEVHPAGPPETNRSEAALIEATGPGDGECFASTSTGVIHSPFGMPLVSTRRIVAAFPLSNTTINLVWHAPDDEKVRLKSESNEILSSVTFARSAALKSDSY